MKKILVFVLLFSGLLLAGSCSGTGKNKEVAQNSTEQAINEKVLVKPLSQTEFLQKVSDYASNPDDWKYLGDKPCVIDFYATWCGPCRQMSPIIEELAEELEGKVIFYKVDVDQEPELAGAFVYTRNLYTLINVQEFLSLFSEIQVYIFQKVFLFYFCKNIRHKNDKYHVFHG